MAAPRSRSQFVDDAVVEYASAHSSGPDEVQVALQAITKERTGRAAGMQIGDDQAVLMEIIARAMGAKHAVEVGTFTGCSGSRSRGPLVVL
jgi:caffeoyl-CoA O-methyltransferase